MRTMALASRWVLVAGLLGCGGGVSARANVGRAEASADVRSDAPPPAPGAEPSAAPAPIDPPPPSPSPSVAIAWKPLAAGAAWNARSVVGMNMMAEHATGVGAIVVDALGSGDEEVREEVAAADGKGVQSLKVRVTRAQDSVYLNGALRHSTSTLVGKAYVVTRRADGVLAIATDRGGKVSRREGDELAQRYRGFFAAQPFAPRGGDRPPAGGDAADVRALVRDLLAWRLSQSTRHDLVVTFAGVREGNGSPLAIYTVRVDETLAVRSSGALQMALTGELAVRTADGFPVALTLAGPVTALVAGRASRSHADGNARFQFTWAPP